MSWWTRLFGGGETPSPERTGGAPVEAMQTVAAGRRAAFFARLGRVGDDRLAPLISESLMGNAPAWPVREGHAVIDPGDGTLIVATDGLGDPFDDGAPGLPYELAMRLSAPDEAEAPMETVRAHPVFAVHRSLAFNLLTFPDLTEQFERHGALSLLLPAGEEAGDFLDTDRDPAMVGLILTHAPAEAEGDVALIRATLILPAEVAALEAGGQETRPALARALDAAGVGWTSRSDRDPVSF